MKQRKIDQLASLWGESVEDLLKLAEGSHFVPAICTTDGCDFIMEVKASRQTEGYCEVCQKNTVVSLFVLEMQS